MTVSVPAFTHYSPHENRAVTSGFGSPSPAHIGQRLKAQVIWLRCKELSNHNCGLGENLFGALTLDNVHSAELQVWEYPVNGLLPFLLVICTHLSFSFAVCSSFLPSSQKVFYLLWDYLGIAASPFLFLVGFWVSVLLHLRQSYSVSMSVHTRACLQRTTS